ncbi:DsrE family protein [Rubrivirga marina]|uniref:Uncharacterized protein n=1 Tax=Rubrivirga marina TaxID=1196024 RepID=A0A271IWK9_9BACT|nr:DsrE family protein [Rubrivirga marina]PAP75105.1 hypothetical protein BSZ37_00900 [Rubrivirga marina]
MPRFLLLLLVMVAAPAALAQPDTTAAPSDPVGRPTYAAPEGVVFLVREPQHARAAIRTAAELRERPAYAEVPVELVVCGGGSRALLADAPDAAALVESAAAGGVRLLACGMSLDNLGIDPAALAPGVDVVPNGLLYALDRQAEGFLSVEL